MHPTDGVFYRMKHINWVLAFAALGVPALMGQTFDNSGNSFLKGSFHFRQLEAANFNSTTGDEDEMVAVSGVMTFDGNGNYTITNGTYLDSAGNSQTVSTSGTYAIGANGWGYIVNPLDSTDNVYGAVAQGIFIGDSTENTVTNQFIAIPSSPVLTNATFTGSYWVGLQDFPSGNSANLKNALFEMTPNGQGTFGTIQLSGQAENQNVLTITQSVSGATYTFNSDSSVSLNVPTPSGVSAANALFSGTKTMFVSADGNFILGYTTSDYDLFFGVKAPGAAPTNSTFSGLYYTSALEDDIGSPAGDIDGYYGSLISDGNGNQIIHQRLFSDFYYPSDYEYNDVTTFTTGDLASSSYSIAGYSYAFGDNGQAFVAIGTGGYFSLLVGVHANTFTGSGVFLNPIGVTDAASYAPITASLSPGELVTLYGSGLASTTQSMQGGQAFPTTLGGVQVLVNGTPAAIYYVSPTQISAILPYELATTNAVLASIQVSNNSVKSNTVTQFTTDALPGLFSQTANGLGLAAAIHTATGQLVTESNPAVPNEYIAVFLTGLGTVTPSIQDGALGPTNPLSYADQYNENNLLVYFDDFLNTGNDVQANLNFGGLAPGLAGLYQVNMQVPSGVGPGDVYLDFYTDLAYVSQVAVPVSASSGSAVSANARLGPVKTVRRPMAVRNRTPRNPLPFHSLR